VYERIARELKAGQIIILDGGTGTDIQRRGAPMSGETWCAEVSHPVAVVRAAQEHVRVLREIEPKLDDTVYVRSLYQEGSAPAKPKLKWFYRHLDLGLLDKAASFFGVVRYGPN
jgi:hypothetical protein